jgi:hypothetical protein
MYPWDPPSSKRKDKFANNKKIPNTPNSKKINKNIASLERKINPPIAKISNPIPNVSTSRLKHIH